MMKHWNEERDRLFFELLKKLFERRVVTVSYLIGSYFNKSWAVAARLSFFASSAMHIREKICIPKEPAMRRWSAPA